MNDLAEPPAGPEAAAAGDLRPADCVAFVLAGRRFALPIDAVDGIAPPPPLARIPHAGPALLGAGHLGGRIVPILDLARLLDKTSGTGERGYDGSGEILRLAAAGRSVGVWVDRVEGLASIAGRGGTADIELIDPAPLLAAGLAAPDLAAGAQAPLGDPADLVPPAPVAPAATFILIEAAGESVRLRHADALELIETLPWTPIPRAPPGLLGIGLLRGAALPILSLAALMGLPGGAAPGAFVVIGIDGRRAAIAVDRIVGLRSRRRASGRRWAALADSEQSDDDGAPIDVAAIIPAELRRIVLGFPPIDETGRTRGVSDGAIEYLAFAVDGQDCALPIGCVERIVDARPAMRLPRPGGIDAVLGGIGHVDRAIELRGQIVPVVALRSRLAPEHAERPDEGCAPSAYVILRDRAGLAAIGVDRIKQVIGVRQEQIMSPPAGRRGPIDGVARLADGELLRLIAPERLWVDER